MHWTVETARDIRIALMGCAGCGWLAYGFWLLLKWAAEKAMAG